VNFTYTSWADSKSGKILREECAFLAKNQGEIFIAIKLKKC